jgi:hypothetical protein
MLDRGDPRSRRRQYGVVARQEYSTTERSEDEDSGKSKETKIGKYERQQRWVYQILSSSLLSA